MLRSAFNVVCFMGRSFNTLVSLTAQILLLRSRPCSFSLESSDANINVFVTKMALMTLKSTTTTVKVKRLYMTPHQGHSFEICSKSGVPPAVLQSPNEHRKTVKSDRGTVSK